jgi:hypothetical protein
MLVEIHLYTVHVEAQHLELHMKDFILLSVASVVERGSFGIRITLYGFIYFPFSINLNNLLLIHTNNLIVVDGRPAVLKFHANLDIIARKA